MPIPVPFPTVAPTHFRRGTMPSLSLSRGRDSLHLTQANGWIILPGVEGLDDPPRVLLEVEPATWDGSLLTGARYAPRDIFIPAHLFDDTTERLRAAQRSLAALCDPRRGDVTITIAHADGTRRTNSGLLSAPYATTLSEAEGQLWRTIGLTLHCGDPMFNGDERTLSWALMPNRAGFLGQPFLPLHLADSQISGDLTVTNPGDADAWPIWTVTGPLSSITVALDTAEWVVPAGLAAGETLVVDTRRGYGTAEIGGQPAWGRIAPGARLGVLEPGDNRLTVTVAGATTASQLAVTWTERWLTAW